MNANVFITKDYRKKDDFKVRINKLNSNPISERPKMSANLYVIEDYENKTALRPQKNKPKQSQFQTVHELVNRMKHKLLNFHLKIRKKLTTSRARYTIKHLLYPEFRTKNIWLSNKVFAKKRRK